MRKSICLLYHDVVTGAHYESSGFLGVDANIYKLERNEFRRHLAAIVHANPQVLISVDDGGASAYDQIAPALEEHGLHGLFFIATNWIGRPAFLTGARIRELRQRGHMIGSHSCSHPPRFSHCTWDEMISEWRGSTAILSNILGEPVEVASVPGGYYSRTVAKAAALAGIRTLFTSEPTLKQQSVDGCLVNGRFCIQQGVSAETAAALGAGSFLPCFRQFAYWNTKKILKAAGGNGWLKLRRWALNYDTARKTHESGL